jgi:hypothetical protein
MPSWQVGSGVVVVVVMSFMAVFWFFGIVVVDWELEVVGALVGEVTFCGSGARVVEVVVGAVVVVDCVEVVVEIRVEIVVVVDESCGGIVEVVVSAVPVQPFLP